MLPGTIAKHQRPNSMFNGCTVVTDGNHNKLNKAYSNDHCFQLPQYFAKIYQKEYYDWKNRKRAKPTLTHEKMLTCSNKFFGAVSLWDNVKFPAAQLLNASRCLAECMVLRKSFKKSTRKDDCKSIAKSGRNR